MLRIVAYVNEEKIDEIRILNNDSKNDKGEYKYTVVMPRGYEDIIVWHDRTKSWHILTEKVLQQLNKNGYDSKANQVADKIMSYISWQEKNEKNKKN